MAKKFATALAATTLTDITGGGLQAADAGTYLLNICNTGTAGRKLRVAVTSGGAAGAADYFEYDTAIEPSGVFARWPIPLGTGWKLFVYADGNGLAVNLIGLERI